VAYYKPYTSHVIRVSFIIAISINCLNISSSVASVLLVSPSHSGHATQLHFHRRFNKYITQFETHASENYNTKPPLDCFNYTRKYLLFSKSVMSYDLITFSLNVCRDCSIITTGYGPEGRDSIPSRGRDFSPHHHVHTGYWSEPDSPISCRYPPDAGG
jgi:hypothetical protein